MHRARIDRYGIPQRLAIRDENFGLAEEIKGQIAMLVAAEDADKAAQQAMEDAAAEAEAQAETEAEPEPEPEAVDVELSDPVTFLSRAGAGHQPCPPGRAQPRLLVAALPRLMCQDLSRQNQLHQPDGRRNVPMSVVFAA